MSTLLRLATLSLVFCCGGAPRVTAWRSTAEVAGLLAPGQVEGAERALSDLPPAVRDPALALLDKVTAAPPGLDGARAAWQTLSAGLPDIQLGAPSKGTDPAQAAVLSAAQVWFQGFLVQSGQVVAAGPDPVAHAAELLALIDGMALWPEGVRTTLRAEARRGLGDALYVQALQGAAGP